MRPSDVISTLAALVFTGAACLADAASAKDAPQRVVSINMCTDQLALGLAAPGQLISVTRMGQRDNPPPLDAAARALPGNGGRAEEVYLLDPDLVLAGTYTAPATIAMLKRLGIRVERFAPANALSDVPRLLVQMGAVLGQEDAAARAVAAFEAELAALSAPAPRRPRVALTYVNSYAPGDRSLAGDILRSAGFDNVAAEAGLTHTGVLPLEQLVMLAPEVVITGQNFPGHARAEETLDHPALRALPGTTFAGHMTSSHWTCGTPLVLQAVRDMVALRDRVLSR